jgi:triacylglycerol lipase
MSTSATLEARVRALGPRFGPDVLAATQDIYRAHVDTTPVDERRDLSYGPHERHRLDLYRPASPPSAAVVFVHGGGFIGGDRNEDGVFYANVGRFLGRNGFAAVLPSYRLAPQFAWPSAANDVRDAVAWTRQNIDGVASGDVPLIVLGQSAGASHVASWLFDDESREAPLGPLAGVMLMSGFYSAVAPLAPNVAAYFGLDPSTYERRSPLPHVRKTDIPLWLSAAQFDPGVIASRTFELAQALSRHNGFSPEFAWMRGHNHVSTVMSLGSPHDSAGREILAFLQSFK